MPRQLALEEWARLYDELICHGLREPWYGGPLSRHVEYGGDLRLCHLRFDNSAAALRLWNFVLTENERLRQARAQGERIVGTMKDLGTVPVLAYSLPGLRAFYPDGTWWTPCWMECGDRLLQQAEALGIDSSFCPVRAMLPAFLNEEHFPRPDMLICSTGAVCDDFSAIAQRLERLGYKVFWWEMPRRRAPEADEAACNLPCGLIAPQAQVDLAREELQRVAAALSEFTGQDLSEEVLADGVRRANQIRRTLGRLRRVVYSAEGAPLPALEMLLADALAIHFCSDRDETLVVLSELLAEAETRVKNQEFILRPDAARVFWVNPVADLRAMNLLENCGGRLCGADFMFDHAICEIPEDLRPFEAVARVALADPMVGSALDRAARIVRECRLFRAEAVVVARIPGASHCAREGAVIRERVVHELGLPTIELEIPPVCDAMIPTIGSRLQALVETVRARRNT